MRLLPTSLTCGMLVLLSSLAPALDEKERTRASELYATYREAMAANHRDVASEAIRSIIDDLPSEAAVLARRQILAEADALADAFAEDVEKTLARHDVRMALRDPEVDRLRAKLAALLAVDDDDALKIRLAEVGWPTIEKLQSLLLPTPRQTLESDAGLVARRDAILFRLQLGDLLGRKAGLPEETEIRARLNAFNAPQADLMPIATIRDRRVITDNRKMMENGAVPAAEAIGIEDANRIRMLAGLPALKIDPALCLAARVHSQDMVDRGFFSHESPVEGRWSFNDRAAWAETTASAENISHGQPSAAEANRGWFLSPGHFRNFFGSHDRIGLGIHETHYTQLFGN